MSRNLREKIRAAVADAYDLRDEAVVTRLEKLINEELALVVEDRHISYYDLRYIESVAAQEFVNMRMDEEKIGKLSEDKPLIRVLCMVHAVNSYLKQKGLLSATIVYKK